MSLALSISQTLRELSWASGNCHKRNQARIIIAIQIQRGEEIIIPCYLLDNIMFAANKK